MKLRTQIEEMQKKAAGMDVFIIGGGPSLKNFDFDKLKGKVTIALNSSFLKIADQISAVLWTDNNWAASNYDALMAFKGLRFSTKRNAERHALQNIGGFADSCVLNLANDFGFTMDINSVCGNNSGAQSLNFITNLKPYRIFLLGYDMIPSVRGDTHWHGGYTQNAPGLYATAYRELFIPSIESMAPFIKQTGIDVINCNPDSYLSCFRKDALEKYL